MKLRCLTSLVATMVMASTAGAAEIYNKDGTTLNMFGSVVGGHYFSKDNVGVENEDHSLAKFGVFGKTYVSDEIIGFGMWEHEFLLKRVAGSNVNTNDQAVLGYVGVKFGNFGAIDYGRNYGILYDVGSWTDVIPKFGEEIFIADNFLSNKATNLITYRNKDFFGFLNGLNFAVQYQGKNDINQDTGRTVKTANGEGYGMSVSYTLDNGLSVSAAYANSKCVADQISLNNYNSDTAEAYYLGMKYDAQKVYLAAIYGETYNMTPFGNFASSLKKKLDSDSGKKDYGFVENAKNVEVVAQYKFDCGFKPSVSYLHSISSDLSENNGNGDDFSYLKRCVTLGTSYIFNESISTTVDYRIDLLNKDSFTNVAKFFSDNTVALGVVYLF